MIYPNNNKLIIYYEDDTLYAKPYFITTNLFSKCLEILKSQKSIYNKDKKIWILNVKNLYSCISLCKENNIEVEIKNENEIYDLYDKHKEKNEIVYIPFNNTICLVKPPLRGKEPFYSYQFEDIKKGLSYNRFAFFNEQGTGKSYIILSIIHNLRLQNKARKVLYITSSAGVYTIKKQFEQFTNIPESKIIIANKDNRFVFDSNEYDVIICSYRTFLLISDSYYKREYGKIKNYKKTPINFSIWKTIEDDQKNKLEDPGIIVLDESHNIANIKARQTKVIHYIKNYFYFRYILSGTPADKEEKYFSQLKFLDESLVHSMNYYQWISYYANIGTRFSAFQINSFKKDKIKELQNIVQSISVRRFAKDVLYLPEHYIKQEFCKLSDLHKEIYQSFVLNTINSLIDNGKILMKQFMNIFPYLLLSIDDPLLLKKHEIKFSEELNNLIDSFVFEKDHMKINLLTDIIDEKKDKKIIIWSFHPHVLDNIESVLINKKIKSLKIHGKVEVDKPLTLEQYKFNVVNTFQTNKEYRILLASLSTLNTAVTLTEASVQIYFDLSFNYTEFQQSLFRVHRIGQKNTVQTYVLIYDNTIDYTRFLNIQKKDFINKKFHTKDYLDIQMIRQIINGTFE